MAEPEKFQHYEVLRKPDGTLHELGRGAMGVTYKAFDTNLRFHVVLKVINPAFLDSEVVRQRFLREARAAAGLRHANVASVFHLGNEDDTYFYAMEFVDGETVDARLRRDGPLPLRMALDIALQVTRALVAADKQKLVHRDIKPANIMLHDEDDGGIAVKVIDFGLAKAVDGDGVGEMTLTQGGFLGTPHFASPEQLEEKEVDIRSDIYSLGVTLWSMLTGKAPFSGSMAQVMSKHLYKAVPVEQLAGMPVSVVNLLKHMLEKQPDNRPQVSELRREIESVLFSLPTDVSAPTPAPSTALEEMDPMATIFDEPVTVAGPVSLPPKPSPQPPPVPAALPPPIPPANPIAPPPQPAKPSSKVPLILTLGTLIVMAGGGALWYQSTRPGTTPVVTPEPKPLLSTTPTPEPKPAPATPVVAKVETPTVTPPAPEPMVTTPTPVEPKPEPPKPLPVPVPKPNPLATGLEEAQKLATAEDWRGAMVALVALARRFPDEQEPRRRLETICARFIRDEKPADREAFEVIQVPLEEAAALHVTSAMVLLAENLRSTDPVRALALYEEAAADENIIAMRQGGLVYSNRKAPGDMARAIAWFVRGAAKGDAACAYLAGESYLLGKGVAKDTIMGLDYLNQAAAKDYPAAIDRLGDHYYKETKEYAKALSHFERARTLDWAPSYGNLGVLHMNGAGVPENPATAAVLFRQGAERGDPTSMFFYAQCLEGGLGVTADATAARDWYQKAATEGEPRAAAKLQKGAK